MPKTSDRVGTIVKPTHMQLAKIPSIICVMFPALFAGISNAQTITGTTTNRANGQPAVAVTVTVIGAAEKSTSNDKGEFTVSAKRLPVRLLFTSVEFESQEITVRSTSAPLVVQLDVLVKEAEVVVVSPNRFHTRLIEAPVSIERYGYRDIVNSPATSYYDHALYKKGIDVTTSSLTFKTISTRGFNGSGSTRVNQLVDGMDNQAPGLNFFVGNFVGLSELDVESMELLPGASSALYGPGGMNGTVLINSKSPFTYQGLSIQAKQGIMNVDKMQRDKTTPFSDFSLRWAKAFKDKFAIKIGAQFITATDWLADDSSNYQRSGSSGRVIPGNRLTDPNYDGVNVYGDETSLDMRKLGPVQVDVLQAVGDYIKQVNPSASPAIDAVLALSPQTFKVSRTGYAEKDVIDPKTKNIKLSGALHYKLTPKTEALFAGYWATGNTVYTGNNRYVLKDIRIGQYKLEVRNPNWFIRSYTTQENAGQAYTATVATQYFNESWKKSEDWYQQYAQGYLVSGANMWGSAFVNALGQGKTQAEAATIASGVVADSLMQLNLSGRAIADQGRPAAGSALFNRLFDSVRSRPISQQGGLFLEKSQLWMTEGQYNLSDKLKFMDLVVGGGWKRYILNSQGTLFIDRPGDPITFNEFGAYAQASKRLINDKLILSFAGRYDKNEDFKGHFTPRATALVKLAKDNNLRLSYQTAYRFPSTQQKYIHLDVGDYVLLGGLPWIMDTMSAKVSPVIDIATGKPFAYTPLKPENSRSYEIGYKGVIAKHVLVDAYAYTGEYTNFLGRNVLFQPTTGRIYSTVINSSTKVKTHGFGFGFDYRMPGNFSVFANMYSDVITNVPTGFQSFFNTPKYRSNVGFGNSGLGKKQRVGFNVIWHWQDAFGSDGELATGPVAAFSTIDAQLNYKFPALKSMIKVGGTNILNHYYKNAFGNPRIGSLYYVSFAFNVLGT